MDAYSNHVALGFINLGHNPIATFTRRSMCQHSFRVPPSMPQWLTFGILHKNAGPLCKLLQKQSTDCFRKFKTNT